MIDNRPIGIFDSGVGGLTVMRSVQTRLPKESIVYLGDTARVPYGNRGAETILRYATNATRLLLSTDIKALVIACNTASAYAYEALREQSPIPVVSVIEPVVEEAVGLTTSRQIGLIGTRGTVRSRAYETAVAALDPNVQVQAQPCPLLVPLAEEQWTRGDVPLQVAKRYLQPFEQTNIDTLILGCTHYPILRDTIEAAIEQTLGRQIRILDCATATARKLESVVEQVGANDGSERSYRFWATDDPERFRDAARAFSGVEVDHVEHVEITDV